MTRVIDEVSCDRQDKYGFGVTDLEWSPDGTRLLYVVDAIYVIGVEGGGPARIDEGRNPAWSPDGATIAFEADDEDGTDVIYTVDASGGSAPVRVTEGSAPDWSPDGSRIAFYRYPE